MYFTLRFNQSKNSQADSAWLNDFLNCFLLICRYVLHRKADASHLIFSKAYYLHHISQSQDILYASNPLISQL